MRTKELNAELALKNKQTPYKIVCPKVSLTPLRFEDLSTAMIQFNQIKENGFQGILTFNKGKPIIVNCCYRSKKRKERRI